jgi:hypothetical protein
MGKNREGKLSLSFYDCNIYRNRIFVVQKYEADECKEKGEVN